MICHHSATQFSWKVLGFVVPGKESFDNNKKASRRWKRLDRNFMCVWAWYEPHLWKIFSPQEARKGCLSLFNLAAWRANITQVAWWIKMFFVKTSTWFSQASHNIGLGLSSQLCVILPPNLHPLPTELLKLWYMEGHHVAIGCNNHYWHPFWQHHKNKWQCTACGTIGDVAATYLIPS